MAEMRRFSLRTMKKIQDEMTASLMDKRTSPAPIVYDLNRSEYLHSARHHPAAYYFRSVNVMPRDPGPLSGLTMKQRNAVRDDCYGRQKVYYEEFRIRETAKIVKTIVAEKRKRLAEREEPKKKQLAEREEPKKKQLAEREEPKKKQLAEREEQKKKTLEREREKKKRAEHVPTNRFEAYQTRTKTKRDLERKVMKKSDQQGAITGKIAPPASGEALKLRSGKKLAKKT